MKTEHASRAAVAAAALLAAAALSGCVTMDATSLDQFAAVELAPGVRAGRELDPALARTMASKRMDRMSPMLVRIYKDEDVLEVWKRDRAGRYVLLKSYEICKFSGKLGPKRREGDRQAPEGFYTVAADQLNPWSRNHLAFNMGYPNAFDRANGRTGHSLMVHGGCSSIGCYAMTDDAIDEIFTMATDSFAGGQEAFQVQAFPFRMTPENLARHRNDPNIAFWRTLKEGADHFEATNEPPAVGVCARRYVFNATVPLRADAACPDLRVPERVASAVARIDARDTRAYMVAAARLEGSTPGTQFAAAPADPTVATAFAPAPAVPVPTGAAAAIDEVFSTRW